MMNNIVKPILDATLTATAGFGGLYLFNPSFRDRIDAIARYISNPPVITESEKLGNKPEVTKEVKNNKINPESPLHYLPDDPSIFQEGVLQIGEMQLIRGQEIMMNYVNSDIAIEQDELALINQYLYLMSEEKRKRGNGGKVVNVANDRQ